MAIHEKKTGSSDKKYQQLTTAVPRWVGSLTPLGKKNTKIRIQTVP
jgi:hypothetical protein